MTLLLQVLRDPVFPAQRRCRYWWVSGIWSQVALCFQQNHGGEDKEGTFTENPFTTATAIQLLAYYTALEMGRDIDKPRNLAKSVTVE